MKIRNFIFTFCAAALFASCGNPTDPRAIAIKFAESFVNGDFDTCNSLMEEGDQDEFTAEKDMSSFEKAALGVIREQARKMKYKFAVIEKDSYIDGSSASFYMTVTSDADPDLEKEVNVDLHLDSDTGRWGVNMYSKSLNKLVGL